jgi:hypothetical protein
MTNNDLLNTTEKTNKQTKQKIDQYESHKSWMWTKITQKGK